MSALPSFVMIHGAWHGAATWDLLVPLVESQGAKMFSVDLIGAEAAAVKPKSLGGSAADFATEPSPVAAITQAERTQKVIETVKQAAAAGNGKVILVGHSLGGMTVTDVAQAVPELIAGVVYLTAFMLPEGLSTLDMLQHETMSTGEVPALFKADPEVVGAMRLDTASKEPDYLESVRSAFYADVDAASLERFLTTLHPDEPASVFVTPSRMSQQTFSEIPCYYIVCTQDRAIPLVAQQYMIEQAQGYLGKEVKVFELATSHSPFLSCPETLSDVLLTIAKS